MSVYNGNVLSRLIDPVFDKSSFKSEFRLNAPDTVYLSNMRLLNSGINANPATGLNGATGQFCINSIQLYDGNVLLDQILESSIWKTFNNINHTNDENASVESTLGQTILGYVAFGEPEYDDATGAYLRESVECRVMVDVEPSTAKRSWLSLKDFIPFLDASFFLPTATFKNLRLVINWKNPNDLKDLVLSRTSALSTYENCFLAVDEIASPEQVASIVKNYTGLTWNTIESDSVFVEAIEGIPANGTKQQDKKFLINGFNNKTVDRLVVVQTPNDSTTWVSGNNTLWGANQTSVAQYKNQFQFRVNGQNKLPRDGYTKKNQRLAQLTESYGEFNLVPSANFVYVPNMNPVVNSEILPSLGKVDYTCVEIKERVNELQLEYKRTGVAPEADNVKINQGLRLNLFGEVKKSLEVKGESYNIAYM
jgi:hypothetical protein